MKYLITFPLFLLLLEGCAPGESTYKVQIEFDSTFPAWIIEDYEFECEGVAVEDPELVYDSTIEDYVRIWDSIPAGTYSIWISTVFLLDQTFEFEIKSDTIVWINNQLNIHEVDSLTAEDLLNADTVEFVHVTSGCFHYELVKSIYIQTDQGYEVREINPEQPGIFQSYTASKVEGKKRLLEIAGIQKSINDFIRKNQGNLRMSTSHQTFYIRADQLAYVFRDPGINYYY